MTQPARNKRRYWRISLLAVAMGWLVWQSGPRPGGCLIGLGDDCLVAVADSLAPAGEEIPSSVAEASLASTSDAIEPPRPVDSTFAPRQLWTFIATPADAAHWEQRVPAATSTGVRYVALNHDLLTGKSAVVWRQGETLDLPLPSGDSVQVEIEQTTARGPDRYVVSGRIAGQAGTRFLMAVNNGFVSASVDGLPTGELKLRSVGPDFSPLAQLYTADPSLEGQCAADLPSAYLQEMAAKWVADQKATSAPALPDRAFAEPLSSGQGVVDLLVAYTSASRAAIGSESAIVAEIDLAHSKVRSDFANSGINTQVRLVGTMEVDLPGDEITSSLSGWQSNALDSIAGVQDGLMDEVHARRDELGADLVCLIVRRTDPSASGIAYLMQGLDSFISPFFAFSIVTLSGLSDGVIMSHELGHNFGCAHDRQNSNGGGVFGYSYGFRTTGQRVGGGSTQIRTIMAYAPGTRVRYFSSPENFATAYTLNGRTFDFVAPVPLGVAEGASGESDNARTIRETAFQVSNYRLSPDRGAAGRLVNVSTRAWVGSGDQTLIGGFVLNGAGTKRILVRAAGPTLGGAPFNVPNALDDPQLRIDWAGEGLFAQNEDWGIPAANGTAVAEAAATAGAFAFAAGSLDAGLVMDLPSPGNFTASVTGRGGAQGYGLVEVYEVGETGNSPRLLNLSTRGFADSNRPMIAGFVVNADPAAPDQRKTMFIRVRGPSLANYGLPESSLMLDPLIEIYDAQAKLVYINDDWDPPSADLDGTFRDDIPELRRGVVDQPSEQAVFDAAAIAGATDMEPTEPGVVIELPPGIYTVFVQPFEQLPAQPADPGVAIVEVFELTPET